MDEKPAVYTIKTKRRPSMTLKPTTVIWDAEVFWTPADAALFLGTLTPEQASAAKVGQYEVKVMVLFPRVA